MVDVTNIQGVSVGDMATLIGKDKTAEIKATEVSENTESEKQSKDILLDFNKAYPADCYSVLMAWFLPLICFHNWKPNVAPLV